MSWENEAKKEREVYLRKAIVQLLSKCTEGMRKHDIAIEIGCKGYEAMFILHDLCNDGIIKYEWIEEDEDWIRKYYVKG